jgi:hypothetical protein
VPVNHLEAFVRWNDVNVIGFDAHALFDLYNGKEGHALQYFRQLAVVIRREVQDDDIRHPRMLRHMGEEFPERLDSAR